MDNLKITILLLSIPIIAGLIAIKYLVPIIEKIFLSIWNKEN